MDKELEQTFYNTCAEILGIDSSFRYTKRITKFSRETQEEYMPASQATRWRGREPGNGRFEGYGLIRRYSKDKIHVMLSNPKLINQTLDSDDQVFELLKSLISNK